VNHNREQPSQLIQVLTEINVILEGISVREAPLVAEEIWKIGYNNGSSAKFMARANCFHSRR